jgi:hypothetical protein
MLSVTPKKPNSAKEKKDHIFYHRAHKKLPSVTLWRFIYDFLILGITPLILIFLYYPEITSLMTSIAHKIVSFIIPSNFLSILNTPLFSYDIFFIDFPSRFPSMNFSLSLIVFSLLTIIILSKLKKILKPISYWLIFISLINIVAALFFIFSPASYPYRAVDYSQLYVVTMVSIWMIIPILLSLVLLMMPTNLLSKASLIAFSLVYMFVFGTVRYALFTMILYKFSLIFMPFMIFCLGPLLDFTFIIGFYSIYISRVAIKFKKNEDVWQWLF